MDGIGLAPDDFPSNRILQLFPQHRIWFDLTGIRTRHTIYYPRDSRFERHPASASLVRGTNAALIIRYRVAFEPCLGMK